MLIQVASIAAVAIFFLILWSPPGARPFLHKLAAPVIAIRTFFIVPLLLFPFAITLANWSNLLSASFFPRWAKVFFPLAYLHKVEPEGLYPIVQSGTHIWDFLAWTAFSAVFALAFKRTRLLYAFAAAPLAIITFAFLVHALARALDLVFWIEGWGLEAFTGFRVGA